MKLRTLILSGLAGLFLAAGCVEKEPDYGLPSLELATTALAYDTNASSQIVNLRATRDWAIRSMPEWIDEVSPDHGQANLADQEIRITVKENSSHDRAGEIIFTIGFIKVPVAVTQKGPLGPVTPGSGTLEDPYTVAGALAYVRSLPADTNSENDIYIKGKVASIKEEYSSGYGNGTYYISDDGTDNNTFYVFRALYLGNKRFADGNTQIQVGDEVIICGKVVNYKGNTPETVLNQAFLYSLNGVTEGTGGGGGNTGEAIFYNNFDKAAATQTYGDKNSSWPFLDQFEGWKNESGSGAANVRYEFSNISARNNSQSNGSYSDYSGSGTNNFLFGKAGNYFKIGNITLSGTNFTLSFGTEKYVNQGNSTFVKSEFHVYASNDGEKWVELSYSFPGGEKSGRWDLASTTFSVPAGTGVLYLYFTADVESAYRLDDVRLSASSSPGTAIDFSKGTTLAGGGGTTGGGGGGGTGDGTGTGTLNDPYDPIGAANAVKDLTWTSNTEYQKTGDVYVKGKISRIATNGTFTGGGTYGNASFYISKDGTQNNEFYCFRILYLGNKKYEAGQTDIKVGDEVVVYGKLMNYRGNTPETVANEAYLYSLTGASASGYGAKAATAAWLELPQTPSDDALEWFHHYATLGTDRVRNYSYDWNYTDRLAMWVAYPLYNSIMGAGSRSNAWAYDPKMPAAVQQDVSKGYSPGNSGQYARGHQLPSADRLGTVDLNRSTFYGTNMTPQDHTFNGGIWAALESKVRGWSTNSDTLYVVTGCVVDNAQYYVLDASQNRITVPTAYWKAVLRYRKPTGSETIGYKGYMAAAFYLEHLTNLGSAVQKSHALSVEALEQKLGYQLFVNLASAVGSETAAQIKSENPAGINWWW